MDNDTERKVTLIRESEGVYVATNPAGASIRFGHNVPDGFSSVELLLVAIAGCSGTDVDMMTSRRAEPTRFVVTSRADKVQDDDGGAILRDIRVTFDLEFPEGDDGDKARARVVPALQSAHEKTCTVSRTVENGVPVELRQAPSSTNA